MKQNCKIIHPNRGAVPPVAEGGPPGGRLYAIVEAGTRYATAPPDHAVIPPMRKLPGGTTIKVISV